MAFIDVWSEFPPFGSRRRQWPVRRPRDLEEEGRHISIFWPEEEGVMGGFPAVKRQRVSSDNKLCEKCNSGSSNGVAENATNGHAMENGESEENNEGFKVQLVTKSFLPDEVSVKISDRVLSIRAHHEERNKENGTYVYRALSRQFMLPDGVLSDTVTSELTSDGVLTIRAPLSVKVKSNEERVVPVQVENAKMEVEKEVIEVATKTKELITDNETKEVKVVSAVEEEKKDEKMQTEDGDKTEEKVDKEAKEVTPAADSQKEPVDNERKEESSPAEEIEKEEKKIEDKEKEDPEQKDDSEKP